MTVTYTAEVATCRGFGCFLKLLFRWAFVNIDSMNGWHFHGAKMRHENCNFENGKKDSLHSQGHYSVRSFGMRAWDKAVFSRLIDADVCMACEECVRRRDGRESDACARRLISLENTNAQAHTCAFDLNTNDTCTMCVFIFNGFGGTDSNRKLEWKHVNCFRHTRNANAYEVKTIINSVMIRQISKWNKVIQQINSNWKRHAQMSSADSM